MKTKFSIICFIVMLLFSACAVKSEPMEQQTQQETSFFDDEGREIVLSSPYEKIIVFYSAHVENLYSLGAGDKIIGVTKDADFPQEVTQLPIFDYNSDPEKVIAAQPDLVLMRPRTTRKAPDFVQALENAGITVVSLYPDSFEEFDDYILKLAKLTGTEETAQQKLTQFHNEIDEISELTQSVREKKRVFFESTENNLRTVTPDSLPAKAIEIAGGINVAKDAQAITPGTSIASFGVEKLLSMANDIDVYLCQKGVMNVEADANAISLRPGFDTIKAIKDSNVYTIEEKLISSPTFRYLEGVRKIAEILYPEKME